MWGKGNQHGLRETSHPLGLCEGAPLRHSDWLSQSDSYRHHHGAVEGNQQQKDSDSARQLFFFVCLLLRINGGLL